MSNYPDSSPVSGDGGKGGRKSERNVSQKGTSKNNDGRLKGDAWDKQDESSNEFVPQRKASLNAKEVGVTPNEDLKQLNGGKDRVGKESGAY